MKTRKFILILAALFVLSSCATAKGKSKAETQDKGGFAQCVFDKGGDQLVLSDESGASVLSVWLYGKEIVKGKYQVVGSDGEELLEGTLKKDGGTRNVKTTLFIYYSGGTIRVSGEAQLYEENGITKSGEVFDFAYTGSLAVKN